jgi:hypothetical protein
VKNPVPDTETTLVAAPDVGLSVIEGARTVKGAEMTSPAPLVAVAVTVYGPAATSSTTNEPLRVPPDILQVLGLEATGVPVNEQVESPGDQSEPDTEICVPMCCEAGVKTSVGK